MKRKLLAMLMSLTMAVTMMPSLAFADDAGTGDSSTPSESTAAVTAAEVSMISTTSSELEATVDGEDKSTKLNTFVNVNVTFEKESEGTYAFKNDGDKKLPYHKEGKYDGNYVAYNIDLNDEGADKWLIVTEDGTTYGNSTGSEVTWTTDSEVNLIQKVSKGDKATYSIYYSHDKSGEADETITINFNVDCQKYEETTDYVKEQQKEVENADVAKDRTKIDEYIKAYGNLSWSDKQELGEKVAKTYDKLVKAVLDADAKTAAEKTQAAEEAVKKADAAVAAASKAEADTKAEKQAKEKAQADLKTAEANLKKAQAAQKKAEENVKAYSIIDKKVSSVKAKAGKKQATISWKKLSSADGYKVYRATKKNGTYKAVKTIKKNKTVKFTNKKLKKGKTYYYKVVAYKKINGKTVYAKDSKIVKVKAK